jgi:hypothetical protein
MSGGAKRQCDRALTADRDVALHDRAAGLADPEAGPAQGWGAPEEI